MTGETLEDMYRLLAIAKYDERYVIPQAHAELADRLAEQGAGAGCSLDFEGGPGNCGAVAPDAQTLVHAHRAAGLAALQPPLELRVVKRRPRPDEPTAE